MQRTVADYDREHLGLLLGGNALDLYGDRLRQSLPENCLVQSL
jgi:hypothetical protein